jgi:hypothetical protein
MPFLLSPMNVPEKDNYLMKVLFSYLEFLHYFRLSVPTFVEFYPFGAIRCIKENDVRSWTLFQKCTMASSSNFYRNRSTFIISSQNVLFCSFLPMLFWIAQSHWFLWLIYFQTFTTTNCLNFSNYWWTLFKGGEK